MTSTECERALACLQLAAARSCGLRDYPYGLVRAWELYERASLRERQAIMARWRSRPPATRELVLR